MRARLITLPDELAAGIARLRRIFTWALAAAIAFFLLLKLLTILWIRHRSRLLLFVAACRNGSAARPAVLDPRQGGLVVHVVLPFGRASLAMAAVLRWRVYTRKSGAEEWYQRWNPFAADAAAFVLVTFLLVQGFAVSLPALPSGLYVDRLTVADSELRLQIDRCGEPIHVQLEAPQAEISGVEVPLPTGSGARLDFAIARIEIPTSSISLASGSEGNEELALLAVTDTTADDVHVVVDVEEARVEDVRAGLRLSGDLESKSLREDLQRVRFLESRANELSTSTFALALQLSRSGGQGAAVGEVPAYDPNDAQFVTHGSLVVDPTACTLEYTTRTRLRPGGLDLAISADGDTEAVNIRSIRSTGDSRVKVTGGSGTVSLGDAIVSELRLHGLEAALRDSQAHVASAELDAAVPISCGSDAGQRFGAIVNKVILENARPAPGQSA